MTGTLQHERDCTTQTLHNTVLPASHALTHYIHLNSLAYTSTHSQTTTMSTTLPPIVHLTLPQAYLFEIPSLQSSIQGYKAAEWPKKHLFQGPLILQSVTDINTQDDTISIRFIDPTTDELF